MSHLRLTFLAYFLPNNQAFTGSMLWDTTTNTLSALTLTGYGPWHVAPVLGAPRFSPPPPPPTPPNPYPPGCLTFLNMGANGATRLQINYDDHAYTDPPLLPAPGVYPAPFDVFGPGLGNLPGRGTIVVTDAGSAPNPPGNLKGTVV
jgi:hypothetical protein